MDTDVNHAAPQAAQSRALPRGVILAVYTAAVFVSAVGYLLSDVGSSWAVISIACAVTLAGVSVVGGQIGIIAATATIYPTTIRSAGVGWALGIGRIGSVVGPFIGSILIAAKLPNTQLFLIGAVPVVIAGTTSLWLNGFTRRRGIVQQS